MRRIVFAFLLGCVDCKLLEEVLIDAADQVLFFPKRLVADFVDLVDQLLDIVRGKISRSKCTFDKTSF